MALDEDVFLQTAFRKFQKIGKGLKVTEPAKEQDFIKKSIHEAWKDWKDRACMSVSLFTFYIRERTFTRWFFSDLQTLSGSLRSMFTL